MHLVSPRIMPGMVTYPERSASIAARVVSTEAVPVPPDNRATLRAVLVSVSDAIKGAIVSTLATPKFDTTTPYWVNRASRLIGVAQGAMGAAEAMLPLVPDVLLTPMVVTNPLQVAQAAIAAAVDLPLGSADRQTQVAQAHSILNTASRQLEYVLRANWPTSMSSR